MTLQPRFNPFDMPSDAMAELPTAVASSARRVLESRIRAAYVHAMRRWINESNAGVCSTWGAKHKPELDGGVASNGRCYKSVWAVIATFLVGNGCLDPEGYVAANCILGARPPKPQQLHNKAAIDAYRKAAADTPNELGLALRSQAGVFKVTNYKMRRWYPTAAKEVVWRRVLLTADVPLSSLFCYCIAAKQGFDDVCQRYEDLAISQYMTNPAAYKEAWVSVLPAVLVQHCDSILAEIGKDDSA